MTTYPTYQSPVRTFQELGLSTENIDANQLKLERKRLLLEIQISDTQTTTIGEKELSKNDVIELFDELERVTHLDYHTAIFNHPVLLNLLENFKVAGTIEEKHKINFDTDIEWNMFINFISPYLANAIDKLLSKGIRKSNFDDLEKSLVFFKLLTPTDSYFAFRKFNNFCETLEGRLQILVSRNKKFPAEEVTYLHQASFYNSINDLSNTYPNLPDNVATDVINFTVACEEKAGRGKILVDISDQVRRLHCSAPTRWIIIGNRDAFWESREQFLKYNPNTVWRVMIAIIFIGFAFARINKGCESSNNRVTNIPNQEELFEHINQLEKEGIENYTVTTLTDNTSNFDESSFLDLHEKVVSATKLSQYVKNILVQQGDPAIISRFNSGVSGTNYNLTNETSSELLILVLVDSCLNSYYVNSSSSITFKANNNSFLFFYSGKRWKDNRTIEHWHRSPKASVISQIRFNGYFSYRSEENFQFLRKFFTLTDGDSKDFKVTNDNGEFEFYQGDKNVNYSY